MDTFTMSHTELLRAGLIKALAGHKAGTVRLWYNGQAVDSSAGRDATIGGSRSDYFARDLFALSAAPGTSKLFVEKILDSSAPCPARPSTELGTWRTTPP
jgi:hypothetical protein